MDQRQTASTESWRATKHLFCLLAASVVALAGCTKSASKEEGAAEPTPSLSAPAQAAPAWELRSVEGRLVKSTEFQGKVVILDFWATWCPPCRKEIPGFVELQKEYRDKGLVVVGVSLDEGSPEAVKAFIGQFGINYPIVMGTPEVVAAFGGVEGIPTTFILDRQGNIAGKHVGYAPKSDFENTIKKLL